MLDTKEGARLNNLDPLSVASLARYAAIELKTTLERPVPDEIRESIQHLAEWIFHTFEESFQLDPNGDQKSSKDILLFWSLLKDSGFLTHEIELISELVPEVAKVRQQLETVAEHIGERSGDDPALISRLYGFCIRLSEAMRERVEVNNRHRRCLAA